MGRLAHFRPRRVLSSMRPSLTEGGSLI
jgi:hypothetical protein